VYPKSIRGEQRLHYYVAKCAVDAINEITPPRKQLMKKASMKGHNIEARSFLTPIRSKHQAFSLQPEAPTGSRQTRFRARV
jgi:hypothetical protein